MTCFTSFIILSLERAAGDELALMGGDGAEGAAAKASPMDVDAELNHVIGRDVLALVLRMGLASVGEVETGIEFSGGHRGVGRVDDNPRWLMADG